MGPLVINSKVVASDNANYGNGGVSFDSVDGASVHINFEDYN